MPDLSGRVFAVTGASGNLGGAVRDLLVQRGASLVLLDRAPRQLQDGTDRTSRQPQDGTGHVLALGGLDLTDATEIARALDGAIDRFGRLDGLVAAIGAFRMGGTEFEDGWKVWDAMLTANLKTAVAVIQAAAPRLGRGGRIVTVGARPALEAGKGVAAYAASKAAILRLTESLSEELKGQDITVNSVLPSIIDTPENRRDMPGADHSRWVPPQDIAEVIAFLLSDAARSVTGAHIPVYGKA